MNLQQWLGFYYLSPISHISLDWWASAVYRELHLQYDFKLCNWLHISVFAFIRQQLPPAIDWQNDLSVLYIRIMALLIHQPCYLGNAFYGGKKKKIHVWYIIQKQIQSVTLLLKNRSKWPSSGQKLPVTKQ